MLCKYLILLLCLPSIALAEVHLNLLGGTNIANFEASGSTYTVHSTGNRQGLAGGLLLNIKSKKSKFGISSGLLYVESGSALKLTRISDGLYYDIVLKLPYIQLPLIVDFWFGKSFSIGAGGFYSWAAGNYTNIGAIRLGVTVPVNLNGTFGSTAYDTHDYGFLVNMQFKAYLGKKMSVGLMAMYQKSLSDTDLSPTFVFKNINMMALGSVGYIF